MTELTSYLPALCHLPTRGGCDELSAAIRSLAELTIQIARRDSADGLPRLISGTHPRRHAVNHIRGLNLIVRVSRVIRRLAPPQQYDRIASRRRIPQYRL
ncbi:hypothetical protein KCP71_10610 [Salmonella enterica subsp. enterica]|nr:hypothetical protein KCP71_10610 [Salmonella enterica subsp. enterica]